MGDLLKINKSLLSIKIIVRLISLLALVLSSTSAFSQLNLVLNSDFNSFNGSNGTNVIPLDYASDWLSHKSADLYLRDSIDKHGNIVRLAPYLNEGLSGTLKRKLYENEEYILKFDLYSSQKSKFQFDFFLSLPLSDSIEHNLFVINTKRKKWITYTYELTSSTYNNRFSIISSCLKGNSVIYIDNIKLIVKEKTDFTQ